MSPSVDMGRTSSRNLSFAVLTRRSINFAVVSASHLFLKHSNQASLVSDPELERAVVLKLKFRFIQARAKVKAFDYSLAMVAGLMVANRFAKNHFPFYRLLSPLPKVTVLTFATLFGRSNTRSL